ncbi:hypothetical protein [Thiofilum flexile]|uniref:hypothetical protein n=1 Tax=Thiofilum flexile TaxID=125627 RepID=UPI000370CF9B|nr:hypothetical protein [Thiofilum flexile]
MSKLTAYLSPLWIWVVIWGLVMNGAIHTLAQAITGESLPELASLFGSQWEQWRGLVL